MASAPLNCRMGPIRKLWHLPAADRSLLIRTVLWLVATRVALSLLPLRVARSLLARAARAPRRLRRAPPSKQRIVWAVAVARRVVPYASCLPQALAAEALFTQSGHPVALRIGVVKTGAGRLLAHAWLESDGQIVVGNLPELARYAPLPPLPAVRV